MQSFGYNLHMKILAIETSCDDTGIAVLEVKGTKSSPDFNALSNIVSSQIEVHKKYGGVYPAMAKREHQKNLIPALEAALKKAEMLKIFNFQFSIFNEFLMSKFSKLENILERESDLFKKLIPFLKKYKKPDIDLIAVTNGPGLEPCLWVGVNFAKALSYFWDIPVIPVNHIESHILVNFLENKDIKFPVIALVVSGGHTQLILMKKIGDYKILGETRDDAAGECFDKCAKILGLGYPGGPAIAELASSVIASEPAGKRGNPEPFHKTLDSRFCGNDISLPRPMINTKDYDFSFSGLKTAVLYADKKIKNKNKKYKQEMAAEIQQAIIDVLLKKTMKAVKDYRAKTLILGGGVSANKELRKQFTKKIKTETFGFLPNGKKPNQIKLLAPDPELSTDNALMVAVTGYFHRKAMRHPPGVLKTLKANANLRIS